MKLAYTMAPGRGDTDLVLHALACSIIEQGHRPVGTVQINTESDAGPCDMDVKILPDGGTIRISQALGRASRGCRLDPAALETAVGLVEAELFKGADCLIVNKFGKHEAEGRGFRPVIADALARDIPVLVGINRLNQDAFLDFVGGFATELVPELPVLEDWLSSEITGDAAAA
ncbi:DUF2478 domain-containing protein [Oricola sp.]|uniref:DUF2478 domain-containing protein n=1 Tax=Oricola sp. TaxID=1979950 RepID=UPI0025F703B2|nr:DUF2478 domain-containing protein [Oricola sp.]MCI5074876.1 DUF2478 domain-containing protein [Oricola sp.]